MSKAVEDAISNELESQTGWDKDLSGRLIRDDRGLAFVGKGIVDVTKIAEAAADAARRELLNALAKYRNSSSDEIIAWEFGPGDIYEGFVISGHGEDECVVTGNGTDELIKLIGLEDNP